MAKLPTEATFAHEVAAPPFYPKRPNLPRSLIVGGAIFCCVVALAVFGPMLSPYPFDQIAPQDRLQWPSAAHLLGTDEYGRDVLSRTLVGSRLSLILGISATLIAFIIGTPLGLIAGYAGGRTDEVIMRCLDVLISFPPIMFVLLLLSVTTPELWKTATVIGILFVPAIARIVRSVIFGIVAEEFIVAARARSERTWYILLRELLPNAWPVIMVEASLRVTFAILLGAVLSFLGFGVQPPSADWGLMISQARGFLGRAPWIALAPGFAMSLTVVAVNLAGDGLRQYLDPREGGRGHV
jgi:peptide/nickel transport system permease protein